MLEKLLDIFILNIKNKKIYALILVLLVVALILFPYVDANFFYYSRIEKRIDILQKASEIDIDNIRNNAILYDEYNSIINTIKDNTEKIDLLFQINNDESVARARFISGGLLSWVLAAACVFIKNFQSFSARIFGMLFLILLGILFGYMAELIPIIINPVVNYVGFPLIQIFIIALILPTNTEKDENV